MLYSKQALNSRLWILATALSVFASTSNAQAKVPEQVLPAGLAASDWVSIKQAYVRGKHEVQAVGGLHQARNSRQAWLSTFDGRGVSIQADGADWSWGLELDSVGFSGREMVIEGRACVSAQAETLTYDWGGGVQEWYVNEARGLEHGYTLLERPAGQWDQPLLVTMAVRGSLRAELANRSVRFLDGDGRVALVYGGLHVFDANGVTQNAWFTGGGSTLCIEVDEAGAKYPLTIDPIAQQAYLKASNPDSWDQFGHSVAVHGDRVVVGAWGEDSASRGINNDGTNNDSLDSGAVYIFERSAGGWSQMAYIKAPDTDPGDKFGWAVAISQDRVAVGAIGFDRGTASDPSSFVESVGACYTYFFDGTIWYQSARLSGVGIEDEGDSFGYSVALAGGKLIVGEPFSSAGFYLDSFGRRIYLQGSGSATLFTSGGASFYYESALIASNPGIDDNFGFSVAITSGGRAVVGAPNEASSSTGVDGDETDNSMDFSGAAYVFELDGSSGTPQWLQQAFLKAPNTEWGDKFGYSVGVSGDRVIVGALGEDSSARGVNGNASSNGSSLAGAAYTFEMIAGQWTYDSYFKASNAGPDDLFGSAVAISGDRIVVGAPGEDSAARGVDGNTADNGIVNSGAAYLFENTGGVWAQSAYIAASNGDVADEFGSSVALADGMLVVGAYREDGGASGVNGNEADNSETNAGAAYLFDLAAPSANYCGSASANSSGLPARIAMGGSVMLSDANFSLHAFDLPQGQLAYFLSSMGKAYVVAPGGSQGSLCLGGDQQLLRHNRSHEIRNSGASGAVDLAMDLGQMPGGAIVSAGETWNFQCWFRDMNPSNTSNFTDGLGVRFE